MNPDIINKYQNNRNLNGIATILKTNYDSYVDFKKIQHKKEWQEIYKPDKIKDIEKYQYNYITGPQVFNHGFFNNMKEFNTLGWYKHNYIAPAYRYYEEFPTQTVVGSVMKKRNKGIYV